jgi:HNH endonuclease
MGDKTGIGRLPGGQPGPANQNWKGGRTVDLRGYVLIKAPDHPAADVRGYVYEHRLVMERELGRLLASGERVRHKDNDPGNNDAGNLLLVSPLDRTVTTACACGCGTVITVLDSSGRSRRFVSGHNTSRSVREGARPRSETAAGLDTEWRAETLAEFNGLCAYGCGQPATQWDHIIPWSFGGSFTMPGNAVPTCRSCNQGKAGSADPWPWIDRGFASDQADALLCVIETALSLGYLDGSEEMAA